MGRSSELLSGRLLASGLLDAEQLGQCRALLTDSIDEHELIESLIHRGLLTRWQVSQLLAGKTKGFFLEHYKLLDPLGAGGMGQVFRARDTRLDRNVAIKILPKKSATPDAIQRFRREALAALQVHHENIVRCFELGQEGETHFLVMELVNGTNLAQLLARKGRLSVLESARIGNQVALALDHARQQGIIHRDVKPSNILIDKRGQAKLADLGLARFFGADRPRDTVTNTGAFMGTVDYCAPEQAEDAKRADTRSDIYSLGCTLYHCLAGHPPFAQGTDVQKIVAHRERRPEPIINLNPDLPLMLADAIMTMLAKRPQERFQTPAEVAETLEPWAKGQAGSVDKSALDALLEEEQHAAAPAPVSTYRVCQTSPPRSDNKRADGERGVLATGIAAKHRREMLVASAGALAVVAGIVLLVIARLGSETSPIDIATTDGTGEVIGQNAGLNADLPKTSTAAAAEHVYDVVNRANNYARRSDWKRAAAEYATLLELDSSRHDLWFGSAVIHLKIGDYKGYRNHCDEMLRRFGESQDPIIAERVAKVCLLAQEVGIDPEEAARLAGRALSLGQKHGLLPFFELAKGMADYRTGRFAGAAEWLDRARAKFPQAQRSPYVALADVFRAMALQRLGRTSEARDSFRNAEQILKGNLWDGNRADLGPVWHDWLICEIVFDEAKSVTDIRTAGQSNSDGSVVKVPVLPPTPKRRAAQPTLTSQEPAPPWWTTSNISPNDVVGVKPVFDVNFNDPKSAWPPKAQKGRIEGRYENGKYVITFQKDRVGQWVIICPNGPFSSFGCLVTARIGGLDVPSSWAVGCGNQASGIQITAHKNRTLEIGPAPQVPNQDTVPRRQFPNALKADEPNSIFFVLRGKRLDVFVNGVLIDKPIELRHEITPAMIGLSAAAPDYGGVRYGVRFEFSGFAVWSLADLPPVK